MARHPDGNKNRICQRAPVLESQWRPSSNCHCCLAVTLLWEWLQEKTSRTNTELESLRQFDVVLNLTVATPATSLVPNCNGPAVPLDPSPTWRGGRVGEGGEHTAWATACPPHNTAQAYIHSTTYTYFHTSREHSSLASSVLFMRFFFFFFFLAFPSYISGVHHFWMRFLRM